MESLNGILAPGLKLLQQLGVDGTIWFQMGCFLVSYLFLSNFLFKPYRRNLEFRKKNTAGSVEETNKLAAATEALAMEYQGKMKNQNEHAQHIYNQLRNEGLAEEETLVSAARGRAQKIIEETNRQISQEITKARSELRNQVSQLSTLTASRILGRDIK